jgi:hypothetical protein
MAAVWCFVPRSLRTSGDRPSIDVAGSVLLAIALACILLALTFAPGWEWRSPQLLLLFATGLVAIIAFVRVELTGNEPLVDLRLMRSFTVIASSGLMFLAGYCINATLINVPIQTQLPASTGYGLGGSATVTSVILVTTTLIGLTAPLISVLDRLIGSRFASSIGPISILGGAVLMVAAGHRGSIAIVFLATLFVIFGLTVSMTQSLNLVVTGVPANKVTEFNGLNFAIQAVAGTIGAQVSGAALTVDGGDPGAPPPWSGFAISWGLSGVIALAALVLVLAVRTSKVSAA